MPTYSYSCNRCKNNFEIYCTINQYDTLMIKCECGSKDIIRNYAADITSICGSIVKSDSELKTLGDLAKRNTDRMSNDQKEQLHKKHNSYKYKQSPRSLPQGMSRIPKTSKPIWPS